MIFRGPNAYKIYKHFYNTWFENYVFSRPKDPVEISLYYDFLITGELFEVKPDPTYSYNVAVITQIISKDGSIIINAKHAKCKKSYRFNYLRVMSKDVDPNEVLINMMLCL